MISHKDLRFDKKKFQDYDISKEILNLNGDLSLGSLGLVQGFI